MQRVRVGEETFFGSSSRGASAVGGSVVGETEGGSFELGFGGFVVVAEVGQAGFADSYLGKGCGMELEMRRLYLRNGMNARAQLYKP